MPSSEELLEHAAADGTIDSAEWPTVLETVQSRLSHIVYEEFPLPSLPLPEPIQSQVEETPAPRAYPDNVSSQGSHTSQATNKENAPPSSPPLRPPVPPFPATPVSQSQQSVPWHGSPPRNTLPPPMLSLYQSIQRSLSTQFSKSPPHTIQRLAELVLRPRVNYRFLPAYLNALDRVLSVSSGTTAFPLAGGTQQFLAGNGGLINGNSPAIGLGSDESLGGALLTPIPWLRNQEERSTSQAAEHPMFANGLAAVTEASPSTNGIHGSITGARDGQAVTQGELLRQEQEAGVVPVAQGTSSVTVAAATDASSNTQAEEHPHARGPNEMTMEDLGPQERPPGGALDMEAAAGRSSARHEQPEAEDLDAQVAQAVERAMINMADEAQEAVQDKGEKMDEDTIITDVDGRTEDDEMDVDASGDNIMPDAVDTTAR